MSIGVFILVRVKGYNAYQQRFLQGLGFKVNVVAQDLGVYSFGFPGNGVPAIQGSKACGLGLRFGYWASMVLALRGKHFVTESL